MKAGFRNSDGCSEKPPTSIQRREPLTSTPITSVISIRPTMPANMISDNRRAIRGVKNETPTKSATVGTKNIKWRLAK